MSAPAEKLPWPPNRPTQVASDPGSDRRSDIDGKQAWVGSLLAEIGCEGLLILEPENFAWLTSGGSVRSILDPAQLPVLYFNPEQRCVLCPNVETQRLFDEEIDGLGFQLKEWPWYWGREQLVTDLCQGRRVACDRAFGSCTVVDAKLRQGRRVLSVYDRACFRSLGQIVSHALEATCRGIAPGQTERDAAGQLGHRLLHRGASPVAISVAADDRSRVYRQCGFTSAAIDRYCCLTVTARKYGLYATAARAVSFGPLDEPVRAEHETACKIAATYAGSTWPDAIPGDVLTTGQKVYLASGFEHEWRLCPQGFVTGRAPVELAFHFKTDELLQGGWGVTWHASVGATSSCDTYLVSEQGPEVVTPADGWPLKRIRVLGVDIIQPSVLER
jgi:hypothetical protein